MHRVKAKDIVSHTLTEYVWESSIAQTKAKRRKDQRGTQLQKGGVIYAKDVERDLVDADIFFAKLGEDLTWEEKVFALRLKTMVNDQILRHPLAKRMREIIDGKVKLCPEHWQQPGAIIECKYGWTSWITKGLGRGKGPRTKGKGKQKAEASEEREVEEEVIHSDPGLV